MNYTAILFALGTALCWGCYSVALHAGSMGMSSGPPDLVARMKAFLMVGLAYFLIAVLFPLYIIKSRGARLEFPLGATTWSFVAGTLGAVGAVFLLFGVSSGRSPYESRFVLPIIVPAIVFAAAPIINTLVSTTKENNWKFANPAFFIGIVLAAIGTIMVVKFKPMPPPTPSGAVPVKALSQSPDVTQNHYYVS